MCDSCGCTPCIECGAPVEDDVCSGCSEKPGNCTCELLDEELNYEEEDYEDEDEDLEDEDEDEDHDEDEDEDEEDEDEDEDDEKDW
jgi:hypothetical protein